MLGPGTTAALVGIALLVFGPKRLPEIGKALGQALGNFKKSFQDAQDEVTSAVKTKESPSSSAEEEHKAG